MYYLIYGLLYLISLLPFFILYRISDLAYFILYYLFGYRKKVVMHNLDIAFPEKSSAEKNRIAREFYAGLVDTFIETIKMLSISEKNFLKRVSIDLAEVNALADKGMNIQLHTGHHFNWEYGNWIVAMNIKVPWIGIYMRINNPALNKIFYKLRAKKGTHLVAAQEFKTRVHDLFRSQYCLGLVADQNPGVAHHSYWLNFFSRPAPFVTGPDKGAIRNNTAVVFIRMSKLKRGYYQLIPTIVTENGASMHQGELTRLYRDFLEENIRLEPSNYLWSHRRWKWAYKPEYEKEWWVDNRPPLNV